MKKRSRTIRTKADTLGTLTERDFDVLTLLGLCRVASSGQVARECFPSEDRARRRLRRLFDAGYVNFTLTTSTAPNILTLTKRGIEELTAERPELSTRVRMAGTIRVSELERHLATVDARLYAAAWGARYGKPILRWSPRHGSLAAELGLPDAMEPDGIGEFAATAGPAYIAVEVAVSPEALRALPGRLERYALTTPSLAVWAVVRNHDVAKRIAAAAPEIAADGRIVVFDRAHLTMRPVRDLPVVTGHRAFGPVAPEDEDGEGRGDLSHFDIGGHR